MTSKKFDTTLKYRVGIDSKSMTRVPTPNKKQYVEDGISYTEHPTKRSASDHIRAIKVKEGNFKGLSNSIIYADEVYRKQKINKVKRSLKKTAIKRRK